MNSSFHEEEFDKLMETKEQWVEAYRLASLQADRWMEFSATLMKALKEARHKVRSSSITSDLNEGLQLREEAIKIMDDAIEYVGDNR